MNGCKREELECLFPSVISVFVVQYLWLSIGLSDSVTCETFLDQGSNPCSLHWQADSYLLYHQGSPGIFNELFPNKRKYSWFS